MANLNKVMLIGNLTADPEVRSTPRGTNLTELRIAISRSYVGSQGDGERREETTFLDVTCWGRTGEIAAQYLAKGRPVFIEGRLQQDTWEDKQTGQRRSKIRVVAENLQLIGAPSQGGQGGGYNNGGGYQQQRSNNYGGGGYASSAPRQQYQQVPPPQPSSQVPLPEDDGDDIPF